ncbi:Nucleoporin Nup43 [Porphyridium purpureum]|uniref:Nucleoporin Nup43 n=1 Tax=Porphyridium purpureum TaxID=35688 RepID=A0A5J4YPE7_PORPP|nr:Nucleoporin Nup43 [Porphyridium purpureum]|eukprot:POR3733..scf222_8
MIGGYGRRRPVPRPKQTVPDGVIEPFEGRSVRTTSGWVGGRVYEPWHARPSIGNVRGEHVSDEGLTIRVDAADLASPVDLASGGNGHGQWRCGAPISKARWIRSSLVEHGGLDAQAEELPAAHLAVATASGGLGRDAVYILEMRARRSVPSPDEAACAPLDLQLRSYRHFPTRGKVTDLAEVRTAESCLVAAASSKGIVEIFSMNSERRKEAVMVLCQGGVMKQGESVVSVTLTEDTAGRLVALGSAGSMGVFDLETGALLSSANDSSRMGFLCATSLEKSMVATGTACGRICLWDLRMNAMECAPATKLAFNLVHPHGDTRIRCMTADPASFTFVMAGTFRGELVTWDRRKGSEPVVGGGASSTGLRDARCLPVAQAIAHTGSIWDVRVVGNRPGTLLSAGEDGHALLWNYQTAAARRGSGGSLGPTDLWSGSISSSDVHILHKDQYSSCNSLDVAPNSNVLACASESGILTLSLMA